MKKLLAILAIVTVSGAFAKAEDKGTEFKFGGEIRERYHLDNNPAFANSNGATENNWQQRNQFHINAISGDKLQAYFNLLHSTMWGGGGVGSNSSPYSTTGVGVPSTTGTTSQNSLQVAEAWMWWKVTDNFSLKTGRMNMTLGDGLVFSKNDWLANPYNFDALMGRLSWDFMDLDFGGGKLADAGLTSATGTDSEIIDYGAQASFKNLPDVLKTAEVFLFQVNGDSGMAASAFVPGMSSTSGSWNLTNFGVHVKGDFTMVDYRVDGVFQSGKQKGVGGASDVTFNGWMADLEVGVNFPEFMKGRLYLGYHTDTGDDATTATTNEGYQPLFYDLHNASGMMNVFGYGNFNDISVGLTLHSTEDTEWGLEANLTSRTTDKSGANALSATQGSMFSLAGASTGTDKPLGTEVDLWAKHNYGHGLTMMGGFGYLTLGNYYKPTGGTAPGNGMQLLAQAQYNF